MIPDYQTAMLPTLESLGDGAIRTAQEVRDFVAREFKVTEDGLRELVPSGQKTLFADRVSWALTYMKKAGLLSTPRRAHYQITERGLSLLASRPNRVDLTVLGRYPDFVEWKECSDATRTLKQHPSTRRQVPR